MNAKREDYQKIINITRANITTLVDIKDSMTELQVNFPKLMAKDSLSLICGVTKMGLWQTIDMFLTFYETLERERIKDEEFEADSFFTKYWGENDE